MICLVDLDNNKVAGFNLITFGKIYIPLINLTKTFNSYQAWSEHIAVRKDYRKKGLATQLRYRIFAELKQMNIKRLYGGTLISNIPALKLARKLGFKEFVEVDYLKLFGFSRCIYRKFRN